MNSISYNSSEKSENFNTNGQIKINLIIKNFEEKNKKEIEEENNTINFNNSINEENESICPSFKLSLKSIKKCKTSETNDFPDISKNSENNRNSIFSIVEQFSKKDKNYRSIKNKKKSLYLEKKKISYFKPSMDFKSRQSDGFNNSSLDIGDDSIDIINYKKNSGNNSQKNNSGEKNIKNNLNEKNLKSHFKEKKEGNNFEKNSDNIFQHDDEENEYNLHFDNSFTNSENSENIKDLEVEFKNELEKLQGMEKMNTEIICNCLDHKDKINYMKNFIKRQQEKENKKKKKRENKYKRKKKKLKKKTRENKFM